MTVVVSKMAENTSRDIFQSVSQHFDIVDLEQSAGSDQPLNIDLDLCQLESDP